VDASSKDTVLAHSSDGIFLAMVIAINLSDYLQSQFSGKFPSLRDPAHITSQDDDMSRDGANLFVLCTRDAADVH